MRVVQINSVYGYGSTGRIVRDIHHALMAEGHDSFVIYGRSGAIGTQGTGVSEEQNVYYLHNEVEEKIHIVIGTVFDRHGQLSKRNTASIIQKLVEINPDVIHLHNIHGFYLNYVDLFNYLKKSNKQVVWTLHDCWIKTGFCSYYDYNECDGYRNGCKSCKYKNVYPYRVFTNAANNYELKKSVFTSLDKLSIVTPSTWLQGEIEDSYMGKYSVRTIHNNVDTTKFRYHENDLKTKYGLTDKKIALAVSSLFTVQKGFEEYKKLAGILPDEWKLVMIGLNDKELKSLPAGVLGIKRTNSVEELADWYSAADCLVNLSLEDVYPTVNIEASSCGLPIIAYKTGGMVEQVENKGILIDRYDIQGVADALKTFSIPRKVYAFDNSMTGDYIGLYKELLK